MTKCTSATEQRTPRGSNRNGIPPVPGILVVDDEPSILALLERVLRQEGFKVWTAGTGEAALRLFDEHDSEIQVVLLDVRLPGMDGPNILAALRQRRPSLLAYFMTGDSGGYPINDLIARGAAEVFIKPFDLHEVARQLWAATAAATPSAR